ncbi:MAG: T9SS type A sorting domain-containing protein, partial [Chitinophagaceae bacterium]
FVGCEGATFIAYIETVGTVASYKLYRNNQLVEGVTGNMHSITLAEDTAGQYSWTVITPSCPPTVTNFNVFMAPSATIEGEANQSFIAGQTLADLEVSGDLIKWSAAEEINLQDLLPSTTPLVDGNTYYAFAESLQSLCMSDVLAVTVHLELGINDVNKRAFQYYPNPVKNTLNLKAESFIKTIELYNMLGQMVIQKSIHNQSGVLEMEILPQGQYILKVSTLNGEENFKIIKE